MRFRLALRCRRSSRVFCSCSCPGPGVLKITVEEGICDVIPEIKMVPEIIADDDETFNLLECVSFIDCAHLETGIVGVGVLAANNSHSFFIHDIVITFFASSSTHRSRQIQFKVIGMNMNYL